MAMKFLWASEELLQQHSIELKDRPFYPGLVRYMNSGPVAAMVWAGLHVVKTGPVMLGETHPADSKRESSSETSAFRLAGTSLSAVIQQEVPREKPSYGVSLKTWLTAGLVLLTGSMTKRWTKHQSSLAPLGMVPGHRSSFH